MKLSTEQKIIMLKRRFRRLAKLLFGLVFRGITYFLIFGKHRDGNGNKVGGHWQPKEKELELVAEIKAAKKANKDKKAIAKAEAKAEKATAKAQADAFKEQHLEEEVGTAPVMVIEEKQA